MGGLLLVVVLVYVSMHTCACTVCGCPPSTHEILKGEDGDVRVLGLARDVP